MAWYNYFTVEIPLFFCAFSMSLQMPLLTNLNVYRTCYVTLGYNESDCRQLGNDDNNVTRWLEPKVQPTVNHINMVHNVINAFIPLMFCMFVGAWSDKFGRKPFMILCFAGIILSTISNTLITHFTNLSAWWFIISGLPNVLTGGFSSLMIVTSAHISDVTTKKNRLIRLGILEVVFTLPNIIGSLSSPYIFYATNYETVFLISTGLIGMSFLYTIFFIPESLQGTKKAFSLNEIINSINIKQLVKHTIRNRENNARSYVFAIIGIMIIFTLSGGEMTVATLFLRAKLHWTLTKITRIGSITSVGNIFGTLCGTYLLYKMLKLKELPLCLFGIILQSVANILRGIATNDYYIYGANAIGIFNGLPHLMIRTIMSFVVAPDEIGKIFALTSIIGSLFGMLSNLLYPAVYNATLSTHCGLYNFVSLAIHLVCAVLIILLTRVKVPYYTPREEEKQNQEENKEAEKKSISELSIQSLEIIDNTRKLSLTPF